MLSDTMVTAVLHSYTRPLALFFSLFFGGRRTRVNKSAHPLLRGRAHLLGEAHDLQPVALPDRSVGAGVHQLVHLLHRLDGGDLGAKRHQTSSARCQDRSVVGM